MARRATFFNLARKDQPKDVPLLALAGGCEFGREALGSKDAESLKALRVSYGMLGYDLGLLTEFEFKEFGDNGLTPPEHWVHPNEVQFMRLDRGKVGIGVILFPEIPPDAKTPPARVLADISRILRKERGKVDLLVGMSPWGLWVEKAYLESGADSPDLLLGSGPGVEVPGSIMAEGRTFWTRPSAKGKTVTRIDVLALPRGRASFAWAENGNIRFESPALTDRYIEDIDVLSALVGVDAE
ncbi:MAG: hypothetical protein AB7E32_14510 [Desulfovibrio sp.]